MAVVESPRRRRRPVASIARRRWPVAAMSPRTVMPRGLSGQFTGTHLASEAIRCASRNRRQGRRRARTNLPRPRLAAKARQAPPGIARSRGTIVVVASTPGCRRGLANERAAFRRAERYASHGVGSADRGSSTRSSDRCSAQRRGLELRTCGISQLNRISFVTSD